MVQASLALAAAPRDRIGVARPLLPELAAIAPYLDRIDTARWYSNFGPLLAEFEARLTARFPRPTHIVTLANGTQAITAALVASGAVSGLCALPSWTFVATAHAVAQAGLEPWFLDVDPATWMLDPDAVRSALADAPGRVAAVVPVSAFGQAPDLQAWVRFRDETGLAVVVDAAAAFDAVETAPVPTAFSLHATKCLGLGEGGFVATEDEALALRVREQSNFGFRGRRTAEVMATNAKLSEYTAAVGLAALDAWPATRARLMRTAQRLRIALAFTPEVVFQPGWGLSWVSTTCVIGLPRERVAAVVDALKADAIETRLWWERGCHLQPAFAACGRTSLPVTETLAASTLGLPFAVDLRDIEIERLAAGVRQGLGL